MITLASGAVAAAAAAATISERTGAMPGPIIAFCAMLVLVVLVALGAMNSRKDDDQ